MQRADLFLADQNEMWSTGSFYVRTRAERRRFLEAKRIIESETESDRRILAKFVEKAKAAIEVSRKSRRESSHFDLDLPEVKHTLAQWTPTELDILSPMILLQYETRSTQDSHCFPIATALIKAIDSYPGVEIERALLIRLLQDLGIVRPWESFTPSDVKEDEVRSVAVSGPQIRGSDEMLRGTELDDLREDFTSHRVYVVDDATARELDDGIALERINGSDDFWVHVHIADPTRFLTPNHPLAIHASFRAISLYMPGGNMPLLPFEVTMKELSLGSNITRTDGAQAVMTFSSRIGLNGDVKDSKVRLGWIKNPRVITYNAVDDALGVEREEFTRPFGTVRKEEVKAESPSDFSQEELHELRVLRDLAKGLSKRRSATAGLEFGLRYGLCNVLSNLPVPHDNLYHTANLPRRPQIYSGSPVVDYTVPGLNAPPSAAQEMIQEFMIQGGRTAARFCHSQNIPVPFRSSPTPRSVIVPGRRTMTIEDLLASRVPGSQRADFYFLAKGDFHLPPGGVSLTPKPHWQMGFDKPDHGYVKSTSPLRRYEDLLVHWQIRAALAKEKGLASFAPAISASDMEMLIKRSSPAQKRAKGTANKAGEFWQAGLFAARLKHGPINPDETVDMRQPFDVRVAGQTIFSHGQSTSTKVYVPALGALIRLDAKTDKPFEVGEHLRVRILEADQWPAPIIRSVLV